MIEAEDGVLAAAARLVDAFSRHDTDAYFAAFAEDASFIFHNLDRVLTSRDAYRAEWRLWEERDGFRVLREGRDRVGGPLDIDAFAGFLQAESGGGPLAPSTTPRIRRVDRARPGQDGMR